MAKSPEIVNLRARQAKRLRGAPVRASPRSSKDRSVHRDAPNFAVSQYRRLVGALARLEADHQTSQAGCHACDEGGLTPRVLHSQGHGAPAAEIGPSTGGWLSSSHRTGSHGERLQESRVWYWNVTRSGLHFRLGLTGLSRRGPRSCRRRLVRSACGMTLHCAPGRRGPMHCPPPRRRHHLPPTHCPPFPSAASPSPV